MANGNIPPDCQGNPDCIAAEQACDEQFNADVTQCQTDYDKANTACDTARDTMLAQCEQLDGQNKTNCQNDAQSLWDQCVGQAKNDLNTCAEAAGISQQVCYNQVSQAFLNSSRNSGKKRKPGTNGCAPCTLPDCSQFTQQYLDALGTIDLLIKSYQQTENPSADALLTQIDAIATGT